ncbi:hypothetical protein BJ741DRAFT_587040 [Chytriomyces cf. hyalinus JEL632]|nr:hypothetical protein BJ741DRAFT_587040 [Chytriomyces cf. hyalinus JEL632]
MNKMHIRFLVEETHQAYTPTSPSIPQMAVAVEAGDPSRRDEVKIGFGNSSKADVAGGAVSEEDSEAASPAGENAKSFDESEAKIFACSKCGKQFAKARYLTQHRLVHSTDKPHVCDICSAGFKRGCELQLHSMVHTNAKPHQCKICQATFKSSQNLKQHGQTHSDVRPHECSDCGASFKRGSTLKRHRQLEH